MREKQLDFSKTLINGADGQFYKNGLWIEMYTFNLFREPAKTDIDLFLKLRMMSKNYPESIFQDNFLTIKRNSKQYFRELMQKAIRDYKNSPVAIQMDRFSLYYWTNFLNSANNAVSMIGNSFSPLLFRRNLELALKIPVKWKFNSSKFQRAIVYALDPELAKEKTDMGGINMVPKNFITYIPFFLKYSYFQSRRLRNKIKTMLGFNVMTELQEAWDYRPVYRRLYEQDMMRELIDYDKMLLADIIKKEGWNIFLERFNNPEKVSLNDYKFLFKIASVERLFRIDN
jgi:hypothetical protein